MYRISFSALALIALFGCTKDPGTEPTETAATCDSWRVTHYAEDRGADGTDESIVLYAYDGDGLLVETSYDDDGDGDPDWVSTKEYNADGLLVEDASDDGDGHPEQVITYDYDGGGNLLRVEMDDDGDGDADWIEVYEYDGAGNPTDDYTDFDGDGVWDQRSVFGYDEHGNRVAEAYDWEGDEAYDLCVAIEFDGDGRERLRDEDDSCDEIVDTRQELDWIGDVMIHDTLDQGLDGDLDYEMVATVDGEGRLETAAQDYGGNGVFDYRLRFDAHGSLLELWHDEDDDGTDDYHMVAEHRYDDEDRLILSEYDVYDNGYVDMWESYDYDRDGNLAEYAWEGDEGKGVARFEYECAD